MPLDATANSSTTPALRTRSLAGLLAHQFPKRDFLIHPVLRQGESMMLWAPTGVGKTMLALSIALAVAGGGEFIGWRSETPRRVLLVDGEMAVEDLQDRLRMLLAAVPGIDAEAAGRNLRVLARQDQSAASRFPNLADEGGQDDVLRIAREHGAELVIADNFSTLAEVADENEAGAMNPVLTWLLRMKQARTACILVHHSSKTGATYRGSSKLATTFEVILGLEPPDSTGSIGAASFTTRWTKFRGKGHPALTSRDVLLSQTEDGAVVWTESAAAGDEVRQFVEAVRTGKHGSQRELAAALGWDPSKVSRVKARAVGDRRISREEVIEALKGALGGSTESPDY
ncbi:AAA family ATPase [Humitalea sp. 24SJ18S-53]|uniref:AAA family ATPase n=1 Tax=Humitalea sp. 24SJ18S-53 TaxID=3422307 RepID=UPI003D666C77